MKITKLTANCLLVAFVSAILFSGCASIFTKTKYPLMVNSEPDGAVLVITDKKGREVYTGNTPATLSLKSSQGFFSKAEYQVRISYPGYNDKVVTVSSKIEGWYFGNLLLGGILGMLIIDPATGAMWKLDTKHINVSLIPAFQSNEPSLRIMDRKDVPQEWEKYLVAID